MRELLEAKSQKAPILVPLWIAQRRNWRLQTPASVPTPLKTRHPVTVSWIPTLEEGAH